MHQYQQLYSIYNLNPGFSGLFLPLICLTAGVLIFLWGRMYRKTSPYSFYFLAFIASIFIGIPAYIVVGSALKQYRHGNKANELRKTGRLLLTEGAIGSAQRDFHYAECEDCDSYDYTLFEVQSVRFRVEHNSYRLHVAGAPAIDTGRLVEGRQVRVEYFTQGKDTVIVSIAADMNTPDAATRRRIEERQQAQQDSVWYATEYPKIVADSIHDAYWQNLPAERADAILSGKAPDPQPRIDAITDSVLKARKLR